MYHSDTLRALCTGVCVCVCVNTLWVQDQQFSPFQICFMWPSDSALISGDVVQQSRKFWAFHFISWICFFFLFFFLLNVFTEQIKQRQLGVIMQAKWIMWWLYFQSWSSQHFSPRRSGWRRNEDLFFFSNFSNSSFIRPFFIFLSLFGLWYNIHPW